MHVISYLYITPTSGSLVFTTDDGCRSSETCFVNLKLCFFLKVISCLLLVRQLSIKLQWGGSSENGKKKEVTKTKKKN